MADLERNFGELRMESCGRKLIFHLEKVLITVKIGNEQENVWFQDAFTHLISLSQKHLQRI